MLKTCFQHEWIEAGCDEAGRGPLAGPVTAAAVILPPEWNHPLLNDSKKMSEKNRNLLRKIIEKEAVAWAVEMVMPDEIDRINILNASFAAMSRAVEKLSVKPQLLLIDGNRFRSNLNIPYQCIVKGDATFTSIAAASVLAKTYRDEYMMRIADEYPVYNWKQNKGYPTREHREAVLRHGLSPYHRVSFKHSFKQLELFPLDPPKDK
jgi:ribonuclease HII